MKYIPTNANTVRLLAGRALIRIVFRLLWMLLRLPIPLTAYSYRICRDAHWDGWACTLRGEHCFSASLGLFAAWLVGIIISVVVVGTVLLNRVAATAREER